MTADRPVDLNAFNYWPLTVSRIKGLGGAEASPDPSYVFHTEYSAVGAGPRIARVKLNGLVAEAGTLTVRIFRYQEGAPVPVTMAGEATARLYNLAAAARAVVVDFPAEADATYAVGGFVFDHCDARANDVEVRIAPRRQLPQQEPSRFGTRMARRVGLLTDNAAPSFAAPVSQGFSTAQLAENAFSDWAGVEPEDATPEARWEAAYILQVLRVYGRLQPEAAGLGVTAGADGVGEAARAAECRVTEIAVDAALGVTGTLAAARTEASPAGFDFIWSRRAVWIGQPEAALREQLNELLALLAPGGLAVHCVPAEPEGLDRNALNRLALGFVADGHIVAELRHGGGGVRVFGLIVRKADAPAKAVAA